ncbi:MAG: four helix bundle suffix domain-containing protein [Muribaculaceae bacterium]|nr:four helix bundle suffix domain-containing protein [Muribaculaceae bacterium]
MDYFIKGNGNFQSLQVYKISLVISDGTEIFIKKYIDAKSRTVDQMGQAARSCKQNLVEGSEVAPTSKQMEMKLTNVARASLSELLEDYEDYLRFNNLEIWGKDHPRIKRLRSYLKTEKFLNEYQKLFQKINAEEFCNLMITLIYQERYLIDGLLKRQQKRFLEEGGFKENLYKARTKFRNNQSNLSNPNDPSNPNFPNNPSSLSSPNTPSNPSNPSSPNTLP